MLQGIIDFTVLLFYGVAVFLLSLIVVGTLTGLISDGEYQTISVAICMLNGIITISTISLLWSIRDLKEKLLSQQANKDQ